MMSLKSKGQFNTTQGKIFIVDTTEIIKTGDFVLIDGDEYMVKKIALSTSPQSLNMVSIIV